MALSSAASLDYWRQRPVAQSSAGAVERGERGARTEAPPKRPVSFPINRSQNTRASQTGLFSQLRKGRKSRTDGRTGVGRESCAADSGSEGRAERVRSSPPGAKTQIGAKPRACVFCIWAAGGRDCAFSPCRNRFGICVRQTALSSGASSSEADYKLKANKRHHPGRSTRRRTGDSAT